MSEQKPTDLTSTRVVSDLVPRVLVVDDDEMIRNLLRDILTPQGYCVDVSEGSGAALEKLIDHKYSVILLDINMPGISGHEILRYCKKNLPYTEIIMISGNAEIDVAVNTMKNGAFDFIQKPFSVEKVTQKVKQAIKKHNENVSRAGDEIIDLAGAVGADKTLHDYKVLHTLGSGNMGIVLLVEKEKRKFAMKILRKDACSSNYGSRVKRFLREAKILSQIDHPNIVKIYDYGFPKDKEVPFIVMEYVEGKELIDLVKNGKLNQEQKLYIIAQVASALDTVHKLGILHRDIKPSNVIVDDYMNAKLTDFGVARITDSSLTMVDEVLGSPAYMSPESFDRNVELDQRSDIFSLGIMSYELLTGEKPFTGETVSEMMLAIQNERPVEPVKLDPEISVGIQNILAKMLHKTPKERFQSCRNIIQAINTLGETTTDNSEPITRRIFRGMLFSGSKVWK